MSQEWTPENNTSAFGLLTPQQQAALTERGPWLVWGSSWTILHRPLWNTAAAYRRVPAQPAPDSIDWSHVSEEFVAMARDGDGEAFLFRTLPVFEDGFWCNDDFGIRNAATFASYRRGTVSAKDSLVLRPGVKA